MATVKVDMSGAKAKIRAICTNQKVGSFAASEVERMAKPYVPFREGALRSSAVVSPFLVQYTAPYARYMWEGVVKGKQVTYRTPGTVSHWTDYIDKAALAAQLTEYIKGL